MEQKKFISDSKHFLQQLGNKPASSEDVRESTNNAVGFFELLETWKMKEEENNARPPPLEEQDSKKRGKAEN